MKTPILITGGVIAAVALGAWLRWAVRPVTIAYGLGRLMGRMTARRP